MTHPFMLRYGTAADLPRVAPLWWAFYEHQLAHGMPLPIAEDGFQAWHDSMVAVLGRFAVLVVAESEGAIVGFIAGRVRTIPRHHGGTVAGLLTELYVLGSHRRSRLGRRLLSFAIRWFVDQGITRVEGQVLVANPEAMRLYRELGCYEEFVQILFDTDRILKASEDS
jgi:ribosomal protein S18 acetylase RimI-like enzyme